MAENELTKLEAKLYAKAEKEFLRTLESAMSTFIQNVFGRYMDKPGLIKMDTQPSMGLIASLNDYLKFWAAVVPSQGNTGVYIGSVTTTGKMPDLLKAIIIGKEVEHFLDKVEKVKLNDTNEQV